MGEQFEFDLTVDLDLAYERRPGMHVVEAYMEEAFGVADAKAPAMRQELFFDRRPLFAPDPRRPFVAVHAAGGGWRNRTLPRATWEKTIDGLYRAGMRPILVGTERDDVPGVACPRMFVPDLHAQARLIHSCAGFVGSDSGPLHVAGATDAGAIVGVFTCVRPELRLPFRDGCAGVAPRGLDCLFCQERRTPPVTDEACEHGDTWMENACVGAVDADDIVETVVRMVRMDYGSTSHSGGEILRSTSSISSDPVGCAVKGSE